MGTRRGDLASGLARGLGTDCSCIMKWLQAYGVEERVVLVSLILGELVEDWGDDLDRRQHEVRRWIGRFARTVRGTAQRTLQGPHLQGSRVSVSVCTGLCPAQAAARCPALSSFPAFSARRALFRERLTMSRLEGPEEVSW